MITLENTLHGTTCRVRPTRNGILNRRQARAAWRKLCGIPGCTCGGEFGERGNSRDAYGVMVVIVPIAADRYQVEYA